MDAASIARLSQGLLHVTPGAVLMMAVGGVLLYLAIEKDYEPMLLLPIGAGCILANLPLSPLVAEGGLLTLLGKFGVDNELYPLLIFVGIGALTDFGPLLENPRMVLIGAAGQFGIFGTLMLGEGAALRYAFSGEGFLITLATTLIFGWLASRLPARRATRTAVRLAKSPELSLRQSPQPAIPGLPSMEGWSRCPAGRMSAVRSWI